MTTRREPNYLVHSALVGVWFAVTQMAFIVFVGPETHAAVRNLLSRKPLSCQTSQSLSIDSDSPRWDLQGQAKAIEYQGRNMFIAPDAPTHLRRPSGVSQFATVSFINISVLTE